MGLSIINYHFWATPIYGNPSNMPFPTFTASVKPMAIAKRGAGSAWRRTDLGLWEWNRGNWKSKLNKGSTSWGNHGKSIIPDNWLSELEGNHEVREESAANLHWCPKKAQLDHPTLGVQLAYQWNKLRSWVKILTAEAGQPFTPILAAKKNTVFLAAW